MSTHPHDDTYALGRSAEEERRLQRQSLVYDPATRRLFEAAGIGLGMKVLDLGSGAGDVAMLVAQMVGPTGTVIGVDMNPKIVETARKRAASAGYTNITFVVGDVQELSPDDEFDAVVGRLVLMYLRDPAATLRLLVAHLRQGGVAAFHEAQLISRGEAYPPSRLTEQVYRWATQGFAYAGVETAMGMKLHQVFVNAGLEQPQMQVDGLIGGDRAFVEIVTEFVSEAVRSLLPLLIKGGIATEEEVEIDTLAARWREEVLQQGSAIRNYLFIGAWARKV